MGNDFLIQFFLISLWIFCFTVCRVRHAMNRRVKSAQTAAATPHPARERMLTTLGHHFQVTNQIKAPWQALKNKSGGQNKNCLKSDKKRKQLELKLKVSHINSPPLHFEKPRFKCPHFSFTESPIKEKTLVIFGKWCLL